MHLAARVNLLLCDTRDFRLQRATESSQARRAMDPFLYFTSGLITGASSAFCFAWLRANERMREQVDAATTSWTADTLRKVRWPSDEDAQRATEP